MAPEIQAMMIESLVDHPFNDCLVLIVRAEQEGTFYFVMGQGKSHWLPWHIYFVMESAMAGLPTERWI